MFLSYASQDAEAAKRIADALRAAGVEAWFDQSELVGGDAWDAKIRKQIKDCALLIPIISAATQARTEGYFRLEWRLADQRTHLMGRGRAFLLPVCIDDTKDADADVPDSFSAVQWTRLPGGVTPPAFCARVQKLLGGGIDPVGGALRPDGSVMPGHKAPPTQKRRGASIWWWALPIFGVTMALLLVLKEGRKDAPSAPATPALSMPAATASSAVVDRKPAPAPAVSALVLQGRELLEKFVTDDTQRETLSLAEELAKRALQADVTDADAWSLSAQISSSFYASGREHLPVRLSAMNAAAERAMQLAPKSDEALYARAVAYRLQSATSVEAERLLRDLLHRNPTDRRMLRMLGNVLRNRGATGEALVAYRQAAALPGGDARGELACAEMLDKLGRRDEAAAAADRSLAVRPTGSAYLFKVNLARVRGDLAGARAELAKVPPAVLLDERGASVAANVWLWSREPEKVIAALDVIPGDDLNNAYFYGPKSMLLGFAHQLAGRTEVAKLQWRIALKNMDQRAETDPLIAINPLYIGARMFLCYLIGDPEKKAEAAQALRLYVQLGTTKEVDPMWDPAKLFTLLGQQDIMIDFCEMVLKSGEIPNLREELRTDKRYDPLRGNPRFEALLKEPARTSQAPDDKSVAVLAFANLSDDKANEYFSDGISEELLNVLAKVPGLKVSARTSAFYFKGKEVPIPEIARQLGVAYVVEGSVRKAGDKVRITAQLIKAVDGFHVWSDTFTRDLKDIFAVQDEIAGLVAQNLRLKMNIAPAESHRAIDPVAYQEYLLGRSLVAAGSAASAREGLGHLREAVRLDAAMTAAWVQIARTYVHLSRWGGLLTTEEWAEAHRAIERAVALEPGSPDVWLALGWIRRTADWNWLGAEQALREALRLRPDHAETLAALGIMLANLGREQEAVAVARRAAELDPLNAATQMDLLSIFYVNGRYQEAERAGRRAIELLPRGQITRSWLALSLADQQRFEEAEAEARLEPEPFARRGAQIMIAIRQGRTAEARTMLQDLEAKANAVGGAANSYAYLALLWGHAGDQNKGYEAMVKTRDIRDPSIAWVRTAFFSTGLGTHPRWPEFLRSVGLADDQLK